MNILKRLRAERGLTVRELASMARVDPATVTQLENDKQKAQLATLGKLAKALEVPLDDLLNLQDTTAPERGRKKNRQVEVEQPGELLAALV